MTKLLDVNVWLAFTYTDHAFHNRAKDWLTSSKGDRFGFCRVNQLAFHRLVTNSTVMGADVHSQKDAWALYDNLVYKFRVQLLSEPQELEKNFRALTQSNSPLNRVWTDSYLAAFSIAGNHTFVTLDKDFTRFDGLKLELL